MEIKSDDNILLENLIKHIPKILEEKAKEIAKSHITAEKRIIGLEFEFPFDISIIKELEDLVPLTSNNSLYSKIKNLKKLWFRLVDKSIKCLRYFDTREPYLNIEDKVPQSYGIEGLVKYYAEFADFEALLYGSNQFYRDHVIHLFRTWLIGLNILINKNENKRFYEQIQIEGVQTKEFDLNFFECISIWTLASLCHDLGYPLEKFQTVILKTQKMMEYLVSQPKIQQDIAFSGTQDKINDFIVRMISSKMKEIKISAKLYNARVQSKYYIKYSKSLENYSHGIVSAIIIYKALLYFLESDFSFDDDYIFEYEDAKQFYMRRDILRSISSHTCRDIYHMLSNTFPLLLIISDDLQEWGRKNWIDLYTNEPMPNTHFNLLKYDSENIAIEYVFEKIKQPKIAFFINSFYEQFQKFRMLFRDGEDTAKRNFSFYIRYNIQLSRSKKEINITSLIPAKNAAVFKIEAKGFQNKTKFNKIIGKISERDEISERNDFSIKLS